MAFWTNKFIARKGGTISLTTEAASRTRSQTGLDGRKVGRNFFAEKDGQQRNWEKSRRGGENWDFATVGRIRFEAR
jgi:hypothetical protein